MSIRFLFIVLLFSLASCSTKRTDLEICFEHIQCRIKSDSIIEKIKYSPIDSYRRFNYFIDKFIVEDSKHDSICPKSLDQFLLENYKNSITVNNLIWFQQFQAYLKHQKFNPSKARDSALQFEKKWR